MTFRFQARLRKARRAALCLSIVFAFLCASAAREAAAQSSPDGSTSPPASYVQDNSGGVWTIDGAYQTLRNGAHAGGGYGTQLLWYQGVVYVLGTDNNWYRWVGGWEFYGPYPGPSAQGGAAPGGATECQGTWTIAPGLETLRNGVHVGGGYATQLRCEGGTMYVVGLDNHWYQWTGGGWQFIGAFPGGAPSAPSAPASGGGTDCQGTWTIGPGLETLRNGVHVGGGYATQLRCEGGTMYVVGLDNHWYQSTGGGWQFIGAFPGGAPSAPSAPASGGGTNCQGTWTIGPGLETLRDGVHVGWGYGSQYRCEQGTIYVLGGDSNWYGWNGSGWALFGPSLPGSGGGSSTGSLRYAVFTPSIDHDSNVDAYYLEIVLVGSEPFTMVQGSIGKPAVVGGECRVDISSLLSQIPPGRFTEFVAVITAVNQYGNSGAAVSAPFSW